jgi:hypothetical protein
LAAALADKQGRRAFSVAYSGFLNLEMLPVRPASSFDFPNTLRLWLKGYYFVTQLQQSLCYSSEVRANIKT